VVGRIACTLGNVPEYRELFFVCPLEEFLPFGVFPDFDRVDALHDVIVVELDAARAESLGTLEQFGARISRLCEVHPLCAVVDLHKLGHYVNLSRLFDEENDLLLTVCFGVAKPAVEKCFVFLCIADETGVSVAVDYIFFTGTEVKAPAF